MDFLLNIPQSAIWLVVGGLLIAFEAMILPGIGFLFAGLGCITVGIAMLSGWIQTPLSQVSCFLGSTAVLAALLWVPLRRIHLQPGSGYSDMIGSIAVVGQEGLEKGKMGKVRWSGTIMNSKLSPECGLVKIDPEREVKIVAVSGSILLVEPITEEGK